HDTVIQQIFATGMSLQATARLATSPEVACRIQSAVEDLDATIRQIRSSIFALSGAARTAPPSVRAGVIEVSVDAAQVLGFEPGVRFVGPVDTVVSASVADELLVSLREMLSNVARHAHAATVAVDVTVRGGAVTVGVSADGIGLPAGPSGQGQGLDNLTARARRLGGRFEIGAGSQGGTVAVWRVPLASQPRPPPGASAPPRPAGGPGVRPV